MVATWFVTAQEIADGSPRWEARPVLSLALVDTWRSRSCRAVLPDDADTERAVWVVTNTEDCGLYEVDPSEDGSLGIFTQAQLDTLEVQAHLLAGADAYCREQANRRAVAELARAAQGKS